MAAETCFGFQSHLVLPWRAHRFRFGGSTFISFKSRLQYALKSVITHSGSASASTTV
jgi:hypothetical protein